MQANPSQKTYEKIEKIGVGAYGVVYKVKEYETGRYLALKKMKIYRHEESLSVNVLRETTILRSLDHPNVIKLFRIEIDRIKNQALLFFELMETNLNAIIIDSKLTYGLLKSLIRQLLEGLNYIHHKQIIHRDVKPMNLLLNLNEGILKIADFGLAKPFSLPFPGMSLEVQTLWYKAPELLLGEENYTTQIDCWAVGCIIIEMIMGRAIFRESSEISQLFTIFNILGSISEGHYLSFLPFYKRSFPRFKKGKLKEILHEIEPLLLTLIEGLLDLDPNTRFSAEEALRLVNQL